jgi:hypothetical protein
MISSTQKNARPQGTGQLKVRCNETCSSTPGAPTAPAVTAARGCPRDLAIGIDVANLEIEIDRLQRMEEAIVVATGAPRERWVVLGVKAVEARGIRAA